MKVELEGADKVLKFFQYQGSDQHPAMEPLGQAMYTVAHQVLNASKQIVPVEYGDLLRSGQVTKAKVNQLVATVTIGYGGSAISYAEIVHEDMRPKNWSKPGTGPKYLEIPFLDFKATFFHTVRSIWVLYMRKAINEAASP